VYNGGDRKGLAADVGRNLRSKGFRVVLTTNTVEKIQKTVIVGADVNNPEVLFVKSFFKEANIRTDKRVDRTVDVLVGNKYGGFNKGAKTTYQVDTNTVCPPRQRAQPPKRWAADRGCGRCFSACRQSAGSDNRKRCPHGGVHREALTTRERRNS